VTFVSVTQSFNTTTSMGRLTLNVLLSFAQFEREVTAERIRDKVKASRMKGIFMGGTPPYGYKPIDRKLVVDDEEAMNVRWIFSRFLEIGSGDETGAGSCQARHPDSTRQSHEQELPLSDAEQPCIHRRGRTQGYRVRR
jgi:DNA invertase Pin-like site-specific DNA recombinase